MDIKARLQINTFLPIAATLIIGLILFSSANRANKLHEKDIKIAEIQKDVTELNIVANEYMMHHEEWAQAQWQLKDKSLTRHLKGIELSTPEEQVILDRIRGDDEGIKAVFGQLVANHEKRPGLNQEQTAISHELEDRLVGQLSVKSQSMIAGASQLENISHKQITSAQRKTIFFVMLFVVFLSVVTGATSILTGRSIIGPIRRLQEETEVIGSGDLSHKIDTVADDEIGRLSRAFDRMTQELKKTTVSRDELVMEVSERKRAEEQVKASLAEKEELLREIHHRVKNNLQIVSSLLDMTRSRTRNEEAAGLLTEACGRIAAMALIHEQLYRSDRFDRIDMNKHIRELSNSLLQVYATNKNITLDIKPSDVYLPVSQAIPCALALNELVTNAFKHAHSDGQKGTIEIFMEKPSAGTVSIRVRDDGAGIPEEVDPFETDSLGLKLVRNLVQKQLNGTLHFKRKPGTEFKIEFEVSKEDGRYTEG